MSQEVQDLRTEVSELREEVDTLRTRLGRLARNFESLRLTVSASSRTRSDSPDSAIGSYSVISNEDSKDSRAGYRSGDQLPTTPPRSISATPSSTLTWRQRDEIAEGVGRFFARCLSGTHRGTSGRDRNPLQSRVWVVVRDMEGQIYTPVRVFRNWTPCKDLVKRGIDTGDSVFCGFPSEREAKRAIEVAELTWPSVIET